jgi:hypothetical protein
MRIMVSSKLGAAALLVCLISGCASASVATPQGSAPAKPQGSAPARPQGSALGTEPTSGLNQPCVDPTPAAPAQVSPQVPGLTAAGTLATTWQLDGGQLTLAPPDDATPAINRARALCTLLAATDANNFPVIDGGGSGLTLLLGKLTIADALVASPGADDGDENVQPAPPLTPFHSRLVWVAVIDPPQMSSCPLAASGLPLPQSSASPVAPVVPYQLLALDAVTGVDGIDYQAVTNSPCAPGDLYGPSVGPLMVMASVPWSLVSRDPGGLFATISAAVTTCDNYAEGANTSAVHVGMVELDVIRPIAPCGTPVQHDQVLRGPTVADKLPATLVHAATGYLDTTPDNTPSQSVPPQALLCEEAAKTTAVAATYPTTVADLRLAHGGPSTGVYPFTSQLASFGASDPAAWCEYKVAAGYEIIAVNPNGVELTGVTVNSPTFEDISAGPPPLP